MQVLQEQKPARRARRFEIPSVYLLRTGKSGPGAMSLP